MTLPTLRGIDLLKGVSIAASLLSGYAAIWFGGGTADFSTGILPAGDPDDALGGSPRGGGQLCKRVSFLRQIVPIVYHHHERYDGSGYPDCLKGAAIPLGARIIAVVDAYDSMTSDRPYRQAPGHQYAIAELGKYTGIQFDPGCVEAFVRAIDREHSSDSRAGEFNRAA